MNNSMMQMLQQLQANPMQVLSRRFNLPQNLHDPNEIIQYLANSGQVSQQQINNAYQMASKFRR